MNFEQKYSKLAQGFSLDEERFAIFMDERDELKELRTQFCIPRVEDVVAKVHDPAVMINGDSHVHDSRSLKNKLAVYFCGNSLGLMPKKTKLLVNQELEVWGDSGVHGHFHHKYGRPWVSVDIDNVVEPSMRIVGARIPDEVAIMNSLTVNLHLFMISFYRPTKDRFKIIIEGKAFPSDQHAVESQLKMHGVSKEALIIVFPRENEKCLRTEDIVTTIEKHGSSTALVMFSGVQYYTGQLFDIEAITKAAHKHGCMAGFDLAHAVGNVELRLHDWNVDFAVWCTYKYLNSGPGSIGGAFIHERHHKSDLIKLCGWWGHKSETRFQMGPHFDGIPGAAGYRMSNPCVLAVTALLGSLELFEKTSMTQLCAKSRALTGYLEYLLLKTFPGNSLFTIGTPSDEKSRGCQLSLFFKQNIRPIFVELINQGIVCDKREPDCIRVAPVPMYNTFQDVWKFVKALKMAVEAVSLNNKV